MTYSQPLLPVLLGLILLCLARPGRKQSFDLPLTVCILALILISWPPVSYALLSSAEGEHPALRSVPEEAQAIVILAASVNPPAPPDNEATPGADTYERCSYGAWLYRNKRRLPVIVSGGGQWQEGAFSYARVMADLLSREGVPTGQITVEGESRSTFENARFTAAILRSRGVKRIVLVTHAYHMGRAAAVFRKQGVEVFPAPCGYRVPASFQWQALVPSWNVIAWNEDLFHEWVGTEFYRWKGWI